MAGSDGHGEILIGRPTLVRGPRHIAIHHPAPVRRQGETRHTSHARTTPAPVPCYLFILLPPFAHHCIFRHPAQGHRYARHLFRLVRVARTHAQLRRQRHHYRVVCFSFHQVSRADTDIPFYSDSDRATAVGRAFIGGRHNCVADGSATVAGTARHACSRIVRREYQPERWRQCPRHHVHCQDVTHQSATHRCGPLRQVVEGVHQAGPGL